MKQNSIYVGLDRKKGKIDFKSKVRTPFKINRDKARRQITIVNDYIAELCVGIMKHVYYLDTDDSQRLF